MGLSHRFDQVLSFVFGHVTQSCSCAPAIAGVRWPRLVGQLGGLFKVYSDCHSYRQNLLG